MTDTDLAAEYALQILRDRGIPATMEWLGCSIRITDDGCLWYFHPGSTGVWEADLFRATEGLPCGYAVTILDADCTNPFAIADAITAALDTGIGVTWIED